MILQVNDTSFTYNSHPVLENVRFSIKQGELLAILGPNGVGKTTLLKCINTILTPSEGTILVDDTDVLRLAPNEIARRIGYVAQKTQTARLTVFDAVLMGRKPHIQWRISEKDLKMVDAALKTLHLDHMALRHIDTLSGGELQKVAIARALLQEPRLLLLDEPTSALDLKNQVDILNMIRHVIVEHQVAGVMTMHDLNTALRFAHKFLFLKNGKVFAAGTMDEITPDMIKAVYGLSVSLIEHEGCPVVLPVVQEHHHHEPHATRHKGDTPCPAPSPAM